MRRKSSGNSDSARREGRGRGSSRRSASRQGSTGVGAARGEGADRGSDGAAPRKRVGSAARERAAGGAARKRVGGAPRERGGGAPRGRAGGAARERGGGALRSSPRRDADRPGERPAARGAGGRDSAASRRRKGSASGTQSNVQPSESRFGGERDSFGATGGAAPVVQGGATRDLTADDRSGLRGERGDVRSGRRGGERGDEGERLQKVLSRAGLASRREVEEWIRAGRITVNGELAILGVRVGLSDHVRLDGRLIRQRQAGGAARVFLIHRSPGENLQQPVETVDESVSDETSEFPEGIEASSDTRAAAAPHAGTAMLDRIPRRAGRRFIPVSPMPRVDGGLELVTSDGDLASKLQRSMRGLSSEFSVRVHGELSPQSLDTIHQGMLDNGEKLHIERCEPAGGEGSNRWYSLAARGASGKDVRQLFERQGALVSRVLRTQLGSLALDRHLSRGRFRELSSEELEALLATAQSGGVAPVE
jgi:23S rRNA pseudouridine2605 synthase